MKDSTTKACFFGALVVATYGIYTVANPSTDGYVFSAVIGALAGIGGYVIAITRKSEV